MQLKQFQVEALEKISEFATRLRRERDFTQQYIDYCKQKGASEPPLTFARKAWDEARKAGELPKGAPDFVELADPLHRDIPNFCVKIPTGGGKTLVGAHSVGQIMDKFFGSLTGLVVWVVPSEAILAQTLRAFKNPRHPYRAALDAAGNGRLRVLTKNDRFSLDDVTNSLVVIAVMLQSTVREEAEALRVFRDSGGFSSFFPKVDDLPGNQKLTAEIPNLDRVDAAKLGVPGLTVRHSLANVLRIQRPLIVIDEGHRAYTYLARNSLLGLNPSFIVELTATPNMEALRSNVLVSVGGVVLKNESLIKLPIDVTALVGGTWDAAVRKTMGIRDVLEGKASADEKSTGRYIRPIALIRVEATGARRNQDKRIHADDVKAFLRSKLRIPDEWIRLKTATANELGDEDLLSRDCKVRVVLTKDALREGWDCSFAYVLAVLNATSGRTAITQMVGRVLRQPYATRATAPELNEAHVVCISADVKDAVDAVSKGLEEEGLSDVAGLVKVGGVSAASTVRVTRSKACTGPFLLPVVATRVNGKWEEFDPERHLLKKIDWKAIECPDLSKFFPELDLEEARAAIGLQEVANRQAITVAASSSRVRLSAFDDYAPAVSQIQELIPNSWVVFDLLRAAERSLVTRGLPETDLRSCRLQLASFLVRELKGPIDKLLEIHFRAAVFADELKLYASGADGIGRPLPVEMLVRREATDRPIFRANGRPLKRNAFSETYESSLNPLELAVVRSLDDSNAISWWWRVPVRAEWGLVGWRRSRIYPDIAALAKSGTADRLLLLESKGAHLLGNEDTDYKKCVFGLLQKSYDVAIPNKAMAAGVGVATQCRASVLAEITWQADLAAVLQ